MQARIPKGCPTGQVSIKKIETGGIIRKRRPDPCNSPSASIKNRSLQNRPIPLLLIDSYRKLKKKSSFRQRTISCFYYSRFMLGATSLSLSTRYIAAQNFFLAFRFFYDIFCFAAPPPPLASFPRPCRPSVPENCVFRPAAPPLIFVPRRSSC